MRLMSVQPPGNCSNRSRYRSYHCFPPPPSSQLLVACSSLVTRHLSLSRLRETSDIEGKAAREAARDCRQGASFNSCRKLAVQQTRTESYLSGKQEPRKTGKIGQDLQNSSESPTPTRLLFESCRFC